MKNELIKSIPYKNGYLMFNILKPVPVFLNNTEHEDFSRGTIENLSATTRSNLSNTYCLPDNNNELLLLEAEAKVFEMLDYPQSIYLSTTLGCNAKCDFCVVPTRADHIQEKKLNSVEMQNSLILLSSYYEELYSKDERPVTLIFYGGEPLKNFEIIKETVSFIKLQKSNFFKRIKFHLCTNGYLLTDEIVQFLVTHTIAVTVAWEPLESVHSAYREGYEKIEHVIIKCIKAGIDTSLSIAMVPESINRISEIIDVIDTVGIRFFGFNFIRGAYLTKKGVDIKEYSEMLVKNVSKEFPRIVGREYQTTKRYEMIKNEAAVSIDCGCYGSQFVIFPNGTIGNCPFQESGVVTVSSLPNPQELHAVKNIWQHRVLNRSLCDQNNFGFGEGCYWGAQESADDYDLVTKAINALLLDELIKYFFTQKSY
jgi:sulfatase maturation enzyme AslB (radical SAM superfamily)